MIYIFPLLFSSAPLQLLRGCLKDGFSAPELLAKRVFTKWSFFQSCFWPPCYFLPLEALIADLMVASSTGKLRSQRPHIVFVITITILKGIRGSWLQLLLSETVSCRSTFFKPLQQGITMIMVVINHHLLRNDYDHCL